MSQNRTLIIQFAAIALMALISPFASATGVLTSIPLPTKEGTLENPEVQVIPSAISQQTAEQLELKGALAEKARLEDEKEEAEEKAAQEAQSQKMTEMFKQMGQPGGALSNTSGGAASGGKGGGLTNAFVSSRPPSKCTDQYSEATNQMFKDFKTCADSKSSAALDGKRPIVVNTDEKIGYMLDSGLNVIKCFTITMGKRGVSPAGTVASGSAVTETGFFYSQIQNGARYQTANPDYEKKGISMGINDTGKILHSDHENRTTIGCIGIEAAKWHDVFNDNIMGSPIFVWSENFQHSKDKRICNGPNGRPANPPAGGGYGGYR